MSTVKEMKIETERLLIKPYEEGNLDECFKLMQDKELFTYMNMDVMPYEDYKELFRWLIDCYETNFDEDFKYSFNITLKESGAHIGWCGIGGLEYDHCQKEIYYLIGKQNWRKGYAKEASEALLDYGFNVMGLKEIVGLCKSENIASKKVLEGIGLKFRYEVKGLPDDFDYYNSEPFYSLTREEYFQNKL
jgi:ribosomal-protein-alanine N-acetyltransferase